MDRCGCDAVIAESFDLSSSGLSTKLRIDHLPAASCDMRVTDALISYILYITREHSSNSKRCLLVKLLVHDSRSRSSAAFASCGIVVPPSIDLFDRFLDVFRSFASILTCIRQMCTTDHVATVTDAVILCAIHFDRVLVAPELR
jgi:hypothetical protein